MNAMVLVVEDNDINRMLAMQQLERLGYRSCAALGTDAVAAAVNGDVDLVLMDCRMPVMDGFQVTRAIRERESALGTHVPIVAVTASDIESEREACATAGMDDFLHKPVMMKDLQTILEKWIESPAAGAPDAARSPAAAEAPDDRAASASIIAMYLGELSSRVDAIRSAVSSGDAEGLSMAAHTLKSPSGLVGAGALFELCRDLESMGRSGDIESAAPLMDRLGAEAKATIARLDA